MCHGVTTIFDETNISSVNLFAAGSKSFPVWLASSQVWDKDCPCLVGHLLHYLVYARNKGSHFNITKYRGEVELAEWGDNGRERASGSNDLVTRFQSCHVKRKRIGTAATVAKNAILFAKIFAYYAFKFRSTRAGCEPTILQASHDSFDLFVAICLKFVRGVPD